MFLVLVFIKTWSQDKVLLQRGVLMGKDRKLIEYSKASIAENQPGKVILIFCCLTFWGKTVTNFI